jgi:DNA-binding LacI/PurR family transcriptional regulator
LAGRHPDERVNYVDVDNVGGARMAVEHLIRLGHSRIATITGPLTMTSGEDRLVGYRQALEAQRLAVDEQLIEEGDYTEGGGALAMRRLLAASPAAVLEAWMMGQAGGGDGRGASGTGKSGVMRIRGARPSCMNAPNE